MKISTDLRKTLKVTTGLNRDVISKGARVRTRSIGDLFRALVRSGDEGGSLVEFAMVIPLLLLLLTGMASVAMAMISFEQLGQATFAGSQQLQNGRGLLTNSDPCLSAAQAVTAALPNWNKNFTYTVTLWTAPNVPVIYGPFGPGSGTAGATCAAGFTNMTQNQPAQLTVAYQYKWFPMFGLNLGTGSLARNQTVLVE
jgi:Flp pilus assembly protein TadG